MFENLVVIIVFENLVVSFIGIYPPKIHFFTESCSFIVKEFAYPYSCSCESFRFVSFWAMLHEVS